MWGVTAIRSRGSRAAAAALAAALLIVGTAVAANGYNVSVSAPKKVKVGASFTVRITGDAPHRSIVNVWLDPRPCADDAMHEGTRPQWSAGESYFIDVRGGGAKVNYSSQPHTGSFDYTETAYAGTHTGRQHICAYVNVLNGSSQTARASASRRYRITR